MDAQPSGPPSLAPDMDHDQTNEEQDMRLPQTNAHDGISTASTPSTPLKSTPNTPSMTAFPPGLHAHAATSPLNPTSRPSSAVRRSSSSTTLNNQRPSSSPKLMRKSSRSSLGGQPEEQEKRPTPKRSISNFITGLRDAQKTMESIEEPVPLSAPQIAMEHFARELASHAQPGGASTGTETVVILHDACYGHRYSRQKATKSMLSMIVERPERIHASVLGASAAYVRLGAHHEGARNAPHPDRGSTGPPPFKIRKTARAMDIMSSFVTNVHGTAWMSELRGLCDKAGERLAAGAKELSRSETPTEPEKRQLHEGDLYLAAESLNAFQGALGGVADAVDNVFASASETKRAFVAVRPPGHHCSADHPSGFCWLNNVHVGIEYAAQTYGLTHAAILDFDLHHGDGSQAITWERNSKNNTKRLNAKPASKLKLGPDIGYYSLHDINSYPCEMGDDEKVQAASLCIENAHGQSIWNVHLEPWKTEDEFWRLYERRYSVLLEKARNFLRHHTARLKGEGKVQPRAAMFISAGFDASEWEGAGMQRHKVNVPTEFYARFTRDVVQLAQEDGSGCQGRVISVLEGGYSDRALCSGVLSHLSGLCATPIPPGDKSAVNGAGDLDQMMRGLGISDSSAAVGLQYNRDWWSTANLHALEMKVNPPPPPQGKKVRTGPQPTYATPTESFAYKVVDANKFARSISGTMREVPRPARPPTPPPPEVNWIVATQELSKLLIPTNRQTRSCTPEELGGVRIKKEPQLVLPAEDAGKPRQLRDRKSKIPAYAASAHSDELESVRSVSRSSRRQTIADFAPSADAQTTEPPQQRRASRRLSAGSTLSSVTTEMDHAAAPPVPTVPRSRPPTSNGAMKPTPQAAPQGVQMKRTRPAPKSRPSGTPAGSSTPASPARSNPIATTNTSSTINPANTTTTKGSGGGGIDALTSGMKKVTLKVGTKEEHDRKQKEKVDAERRARALKGAETRRVNAAAKRAAAAREAAVVPGNVDGQGLPAAQKHVVSLAEADSNGVGVGGMEHTLPDASTSEPALNVSTPSLQQPTTTYTDMQGHANAGAVPELSIGDSLNAGPAVPQPSHPLEPSVQASLHDYVPSHQNTSFLSPPIPAPAQAHQGPDNAAQQIIYGDHYTDQDTLPSPIQQVSSRSSRDGPVQKPPVWNSTGPIPFAPSPASTGNAGDHQQQQQHEQRYTQQPDFLASNGKAPEQSGEIKVEESKDASVWDVPVTPQK